MDTELLHELDNAIQMDDMEANQRHLSLPER